MADRIYKRIGDSETDISTNQADISTNQSDIGVLQDPTSMSDSLATKLGLKQYESVASGISISGPNWNTTTRAVFVPYQVQDGTWRCKFNIRGTTNNVTSITLTVGGITFKAGADQAGANYPASSSGRLRILQNSGNLFIVGEAASTSWQVAADVELESKPTWAV